MKTFNFMIVLLIGLAILVHPTQKMEDTGYGKIPLYFIPNKGQVNRDVRFYARTPHYTLWMTQKGLVFDSMKREKIKENSGKIHSKFKIQNSKLLKHDVSRLVFVNAGKNPAMILLNMSDYRVNFFTGGEPSGWKTDIPTSKAVLYKNLYNHIDLKVYGIEKQVEYDFIIKPGGNPGDIRFEYKHVKGTRLDDEGNLLIGTEFGEWAHKKPVGYQWIGDQNDSAANIRQKAVHVTFKKTGKNTYGFEVGDYDKRLELIIDPVVLLYSTYFGGENIDYPSAIAVDSEGNAYITGYTLSPDFPTENAFQENLHLSEGGYYGIDVFITKLSSPGDALVYSTYLGGTDYDSAAGIAVDSSGNVYVTGDTASPDFPTANPFRGSLKINPWGYGTDAFVTKLSPSGNALVYSTYLGGTANENAAALAVDSSGNAYVTGDTYSQDFPVENPFQENINISYGGIIPDAFITKLSASGNTLVYSTYLGGDSYEYSRGIAVDDSGSAYVTGGTNSTDFPTKNPFRSDRGGGDAFVTKFSPPGDTLVYSTYLGGSEYDEAAGIAVDSSGHAYVAGTTASEDFPTENPFQEHLRKIGEGYHQDAFITKLTPAGDTLVYSTYLGGSGYDEAAGIAVDSRGYAYVAGITPSEDFPTKNPSQLKQLLSDAFVTILAPPGNRLVYSTYLGGSAIDGAAGIAVDSSGNAYVTGATSSSDFPVMNPHRQFRAIVGGFENVFAAKIHNFPFSIQVSRKEERAWLIRRQYAEILLTVDNPGDIPVSNYVIYRKESNGTTQYQAIKDIPAPEVQGGTYTYYDLLPRGDNAYTYKVEALDANGTVVGASNEYTI